MRLPCLTHQCVNPGVAPQGSTSAKRAWATSPSFSDEAHDAVPGQVLHLLTCLQHRQAFTYSLALAASMRMRIQVFPSFRLSVLRFGWLHERCGQAPQMTRPYKAWHACRQLKLACRQLVYSWARLLALGTQLQRDTRWRYSCARPILPCMSGLKSGETRLLLLRVCVPCHITSDIA